MQSPLATCWCPNQLTHTHSCRLQRDVNANALHGCCRCCCFVCFCCSGGRWCVYAMPKASAPCSGSPTPQLLPAMAPLHNNGTWREALSVTINCPVNLYLSISWPFPTTDDRRAKVLLGSPPPQTTSGGPLYYLDSVSPFFCSLRVHCLALCAWILFGDSAVCARVHIKFAWLACAAKKGREKQERNG